MIWINIEIPFPPPKAHYSYEIKKEIHIYPFYCRDCDFGVCLSHRIKFEDICKMPKY